MVIRSYPTTIRIQIAIVITTDIVVIIRRTTAPVGRHSWQSTYRRTCTKVFLDKHYWFWCSCFLIENPYSLVACGSQIRKIHHGYGTCGKVTCRRGTRQSSRGIDYLIAIVGLVGGNLHTCPTIAIIGKLKGKLWFLYRLFYLYILIGLTERSPCILHPYLVGTWRLIREMIA